MLKLITRGFFKSMSVQKGCQNQRAILLTVTQVVIVLQSFFVGQILFFNAHKTSTTAWYGRDRHHVSQYVSTILATKSQWCNSLHDPVMCLDRLTLMDGPHPCKYWALSLYFIVIFHCNVRKEYHINLLRFNPILKNCDRQIFCLPENWFRLVLWT